MNLHDHDESDVDGYNSDDIYGRWNDDDDDDDDEENVKSSNELYWW